MIYESEQNLTLELGVKSHSSSKGPKSVYFLTVVLYCSLKFYLFCNISKAVYVP